MLNKTENETFMRFVIIEEDCSLSSNMNLCIRNSILNAIIEGLLNGFFFFA